MVIFKIFKYQKSKPLMGNNIMAHLIYLPPHILPLGPLQVDISPPHILKTNDYYIHMFPSNNNSVLNSFLLGCVNNSFLHIFFFFIFCSFLFFLANF